ncbi:MAG: formate/nitrite transporter family protein [Acidobacteriia bacterium]|nr:formate/nitrite transporter family protein [Terriglobia bacterium]
MKSIFGAEAYSPAEVARRVESVGVTKARLPLLTMVILGVLAGGFIGLGSLFFTLMVSDPGLGFAASRLLGGISFSLGLILVVIAGAELFTGNNLLVMAWATRKISTTELLRNWLVVFLSNAVGAMGLALVVVLAEHPDMNQSGIAKAAIRIAAAKTALPFWEAFFKGVLCNILVCLAVWMAMAGRSLADKILAVVFPITAFVAAGFEHCVANLYFIPMGILLQHSEAASGVPGIARLNVWGMLGNLAPVTLGNILGGSGMVALVYYVVYLRKQGSGGST